MGGVGIISVDKVIIIFGSSETNNNKNTSNLAVAEPANNVLAIVFGVTIPSVVVIVLVIVGCVIKKRS
jgi:hypothetical protein